MPDREKVIKVLEEVSDYFFDVYRNDTDSYKCEKAQEYSDAAVDALALLKEHEAREQCLKTKCVICPHCEHCDVDENGLLKEQEAVEPTFRQGEDGIFVWACGSCGAYMYHIYDGIDKAKEYAKYCRQCGKR